MNIYVNYAVSVLSGILVCIPLICKVVQLVKMTIKSKNWSVFLELLLATMENAQSTYNSGLDRKAYVMSTVEELSKKANYPMTDEDYEKVDKMVDSFVAMANIVGVRKQTTEKKEKKKKSEA